MITPTAEIRSNSECWKDPSLMRHVIPVNRDRSGAERFRRVFDAHLGDLWRFARRRGHSAADADDVTAQVFAVAWRRPELPDRP